jgi:hypothetical protein
MSFALGNFDCKDDKKSVISNGDTTIESVVYTDPKFAKKIVDYFSPQFGEDANFTYQDGSKKQPEGFVLSVCHWKRWHKGGTKWADWTS